ncbi:MAG: T9SS type A sorting domain-containing protein [Bacteroidia bacterium]|nr:T9SS type A sorting domain-containing protein [Bacteroidia bacterium]
MLHNNLISKTATAMLALSFAGMLNISAKSDTYSSPSCYAEEVISYNYTKQNDGGFIEAARTIGSNALGQPQDSDAPTAPGAYNFASLGFGGEITLKFGSAIKNGEGNDLKVFETSFGTPLCGRYPERARVFASQDGCHFVFLGEACQDAEFDLGSLNWAQYVKIVDISPIGGFPGQIADGYDVDGIMCLNGFEENPSPSALLAGAAAAAFDYFPGTRQNGSPIHPSRINPNMAVGFPQNNNTVNFVSLGFGGQVTLRFDYVVFDNPSANDLKVVETSYGNPACSKYPETAIFEGSLDGNNWVYLGELCQDGEIDITAAGVIQYLRITDHSKTTKFSSSADGFDVDGVVVINDCTTDGPKRVEDDLNTPDEIFSSEVYPNPFNNELNVQINGLGAEQLSLHLVNYLGQSVRSEVINAKGNANLVYTMNLAELKSGVYFLSISTPTSKEVQKVVKR